MDRIVSFLLLLVAAVLLVPGCIADEQVIPETTEVVPEATVTEDVVENVTAEVVEATPGYDVIVDMNTTSLNMTRNQTALVQLPEDETTGFEWNATLSEGLTLVNATHIEAEEGVENVSAFHQWFIEAVTSGEQTFTAVEKKADSEETGNEYTLNILVE